MLNLFATLVLPECWAGFGFVFRKKKEKRKKETQLSSCWTASQISQVIAQLLSNSRPDFCWLIKWFPYIHLWSAKEIILSYLNPCALQRSVVAFPLVASLPFLSSCLVWLLFQAPRIAKRVWMYYFFFINVCDIYCNLTLVLVFISHENSFKSRPMCVYLTVDFSHY